MTTVTATRLNFACGGTRWPGFDNTDINGEPGTRYVDLEDFPYPYEDNSAELILISHALQMTSDGTTPVHPDPLRIMCEFHRILEPGGWLRIDDNPWRIYGPDDTMDANEAAAAFPLELRFSRAGFMDSLRAIGFRTVREVSPDATSIPAAPTTFMAILGNHAGHISFSIEAQK